MTVMTKPTEQKHQPIIELSKLGAMDEKRLTRLVFKLSPTGDMGKDVKTFTDAMEKYASINVDAIILFTDNGVYSKLLDNAVLKSDGVSVELGKTHVLEMLTDFSDSHKVKEMEDRVRNLVDALSYSDGGGIPLTFNVIEIHDGVEIRRGKY